MFTRIEDRIFASHSTHPEFGIKVTEGDTGEYAKATRKLVKLGMLKLRSTEECKIQCFSTTSTSTVATYDMTEKGRTAWLAHR